MERVFIGLLKPNYLSLPSELQVSLGFRKQSQAA